MLSGLNTTPGNANKSAPKHGSIRLARYKNLAWMRSPMRPNNLGSDCLWRLHPTQAKNDEPEPDWNAEMSIFNKRISRPNQLATLRELESKVAVGKVLYCKENLAIISGLNSDAPIGTKLSFVTGGVGVLLWHRSENLVFALILGGASLISVGEGVECKIKGVLQVVDEVKGPSTRKDYDILQAPTGDKLFGKLVNYVGYQRNLMAAEEASASMTIPAVSADVPAVPPIGFDKVRPLINPQIDMQCRDQISECLMTGVKGLDILTPLGRGMSFLVIGPRGTGKTTLGLDTILAQRATGVKCIYASVASSDEELSNTLSVLRSKRALENTAIISAPPGASIGEQLATISAACSLGERVRDEGGHALVVIDTVKPLVDAWESFILGLSGLGQRTALEGLMKDAEGRDIAIPSSEGEEQLVDYQGMLVSGAIAQRRGFFSTLFMRPAKMNSSLGGGSMTIINLVPGNCATGISKFVDMSKYQTLSEEQKAKIKLALDKKYEDGMRAQAAPGEMVTEVVEEFISIADGQVVLGQRTSEGLYQINPKLSITRVGTRAYPKALTDLAPQVRLDLAQAADARNFSIGSDNSTKRADVYTERLQAALLQHRHEPVALEDQVILLLAVQRGIANGIEVEQVPAYLASAVKFVHAAAFGPLQELASTKILTAVTEKAILDALVSFVQLKPK